MARATITGEDQFTDFIIAADEEYDVSIYASEGFDGKITVQRQPLEDDELLSPWRDTEIYNVADFDHDIERIGCVATEFRVRLGCKVGDYVAGLVQVEVKARG